MIYGPLVWDSLCSKEESEESGEDRNKFEFFELSRTGVDGGETITSGAVAFV